MVFRALRETLCMTIRCSKCSKIFIASFLFFIFNILVYVNNVKHSQFYAGLLYSNNVFTTRSTTSPTTNHTMDWNAPELAAFVSPLDAKDRDILDRMFRKLIEAVESANLPYFMIGGTLIGSLRHHGRIPWDDDVDVMLSASDASKVKDVLSSYDPNFRLLVTMSNTEISMKYFPVNGRKLPSHPKYRTPYVDIWFFYENKTHIWVTNRYWMPSGTWPKRIVFPLTRRPYGELFLSAPCNGIVAIGYGTNISLCQSRYFNHLTENFPPNKFEIPCDRLVNLYPFVKRSSDANGSSNRMKETLMIGNWSIREIMVDKFC